MTCGREGVSRETLERLEVFVSLLRRWSPRINLLGTAELDQVWDRHIWDSAQLIDHMPASTRSAADLGSGAGFPGLILCILSGLPFTLVEADRRKAAFLREAARVTGAAAVVATTRVEQLRLQADLVTTRAFASVDRLLLVAEPLLSPDGTCLLLKGATAPLEVVAAKRAWDMTVVQTPNILSDGYVLAISGIRRRKP